MLFEILLLLFQCHPKFKLTGCLDPKFAALLKYLRLWWRKFDYFGSSWNIKHLQGPNNKLDFKKSQFIIPLSPARFIPGSSSPQGGRQSMRWNGLNGYHPNTSTTDKLAIELKPTHSGWIQKIKIKKFFDGCLGNYSGDVPRQSGLTRWRRADGGTSYQPGDTVRCSWMISGSSARVLHRRHFHPLFTPSLFILFPQEGQSGGRCLTISGQVIIWIFSRLMLPFLQLPQILISSPGARPRMTSRNPLVGSYAIHRTSPEVSVRRNETCPPRPVSGEPETLPVRQYEYPSARDAMVPFSRWASVP